MKVGIMQPYFFPYIGYWQLMNLVDKYVIYDDVNYINRGWINRNRILSNGTVKYFNLPLFGASQNKLINEIKVNNESKEIKRNLCILHDSYRKAPYYDEVFELLRIALKENTSTTLADYLFHTFKVVCAYLDIKTELIMSSSFEKKNALKGEARIIDICKRLDATDYYNAIGGKALYYPIEFINNNINLHFLKCNDIRYKQFGNSFCDNLSIIDVLMFNRRDDVIRMLNDYTIEDY